MKENKLDIIIKNLNNAFNEIKKLEDLKESNINIYVGKFIFYIYLSIKDIDKDSSDIFKKDKISILFKDYLKSFSHYIMDLKDNDFKEIYNRDDYEDIDDKVTDWIANYLPDNWFSIILPTYNRSSKISTAIDSVISQTYRNWQLIIVQDGYDKDTEKLVKEKYSNYIDNRKIVYYCKEHSGLSATRNYGLKYSTNDWICYLDDDNILLPTYLQIFKNAINNDPNYFFFHSRFLRLYEGTASENRPFDRNILLKGNYIDAGTICHHRYLYEEYGGFDESLKCMEDWDLILNYSQYVSCKAIDSITLLYTDDYNVESNRLSINKNRMLYYTKEVRKKYVDYITVIIPTYNHEKYLRQAIDSVLNQNLNNKLMQILISDDGSTDDTLNIVKEYAESYPNIIYNISSSNHLGLSNNYKYLVSKAEGDYIAILEGDDYWIPGKLDNMLKLFKANKELNMIFSSCVLFDENLNKVIGITNPSYSKNIVCSNDIIESHEQNMIINLSSCMFRSDALKNIPDDLYSDYLFSEISLEFYFTKNCGKIGYICQPGNIYRIHNTGTWSGLSDIEKIEMFYKTRKSAYKYADENGKKVLLNEMLRFSDKLIEANIISPEEIDKMRLEIKNDSKNIEFIDESEELYKPLITKLFD